jgi:phenylacetate-CoA ligase
MEETFDGEVFDHYGAEETGNLAWECPTHSGYHINTESAIMEFLNHGEPVAPGQPGEVHVTSLRRMVTPVMRYFLGDVATPLDEDCPCGRGLPMLKDIEGRILDFIMTLDGHTVSPFVILSSLGVVDGLEQYKVIQERDFSIEVLVKTKKHMADSVLQNVEQRCKILFENMPVTIKPVDTTYNPQDHKPRLVESRVSGA